MTPTRLTEGQRSALKSRLRAMGIDIGPAPKKAELLALAEAHGIDLDALPRSSGAASLLDDVEVIDDNAEEDKRVNDLIATAGALPTVADILAKLGSGDFTNFRAGIEALHKEAVKPAVTVEKIVEKIVDRVVEKRIDPITCQGHIPQRVRAEPIHTVLGIPAVSSRAPTLAIWDAPDAPAIDQDYAWPDQTAMIVAQMNRGRNVFLSGPRGCGKSTFAEQLAARQHRPFVRIQCHEQTDAATLVGMTVPDGKGGVKWQDGILAHAIRRPGTVILIDEPSIARPGALFAFQAVLDAARALVSEETGERIPVAPGVSFFLADNTQGHGDEKGLYAGTRAINSATLDRCGLLVMFGWLPADKEAKAIAAHTGCTRALADHLVAFARITREAADQGRLSSGMGPRRLIAWAESITDGFEGESTFDATVHDMAPQEDRETLRQLFKANVNPTELRKLTRA